jgi:hypothetical protein
MIRHKIITRRSKSGLVVDANKLGEDEWAGQSIVYEENGDWSMLLTKDLDN